MQRYIGKEREIMNLFSPVTDLRGVGPARAEVFRKLDFASEVSEEFLCTLACTDEEVWLV